MIGLPLTVQDRFVGIESFSANATADIVGVVTDDSTVHFDTLMLVWHGKNKG